MNRKKKELLVSHLAQEFITSEASFVISCNMNAKAVQSFKKKLKLAGARMTVAKNTLLRLVVKEAPVANELKPHFNQQTALVFSSHNSTEIASLIKKSGQQIAVKGGLFQGTVIDAAKFTFIASIPSIEVLHARLCGVLLAPLSKLAFIIKAASEKTKQD